MKMMLIVMLSVSVLTGCVSQPTQSNDPVINATLLSYTAEHELRKRLERAHPQTWQDIQPALESLRKTRDIVSNLIVNGEDPDSGMTVHTAVFYSIGDWQDIVHAVDDSGVSVDGVLMDMYNEVLAGFERVTQLSGNGFEREALTELGLLIARVVAARHGILLPQSNNQEHQNNGKRQENWPRSRNVGHDDCSDHGRKQNPAQGQPARTHVVSGNIKACRPGIQRTVTV